MPVAKSDHEFGGVSTDLKLSLVEQYLHAFTRVLRPIFDELWYIDAFAGTGERTEQVAATEASLWDEAREARIERRRGSARIALQVEPAFDRVTFIDLKASHVRALDGLKLEHAGRNIEVIRADANLAICSAIKAQRSWAGTRAVMFLDPYGMHVDWTTLEAIRATESVDLWYLVSLEGLFRQAALDRGKLTETKRRAITRMLGTAAWEDEWYAPKRRGTLLDFMDPEWVAGAEDRSVRTATVDDIEAFVHRRLEGLFPKVPPPLRLKNKAGVGALTLFFAPSNPNPSAYQLATRIAGHILKSGMSSQVRPRN